MPFTRLSWRSGVCDLVLSHGQPGRKTACISSAKRKAVKHATGGSASAPKPEGHSLSLKRIKTSTTSLSFVDPFCCWATIGLLLNAGPNHSHLLICLLYFSPACPMFSWRLLLTLHWWRYTDDVTLMFAADVTLMTSHSDVTPLPTEILLLLPACCDVIYTCSAGAPTIMQAFDQAQSELLNCIAPRLDCILISFCLDWIASCLHCALIGLHLACIAPWIDCILIA